MNGIEEKFFKTFDIQPYERYRPVKSFNFGGDKGYKYTRESTYPEITAEILLELICISSTVYPITINFKEDINELKEFILDFYIRHNKEIGKQQVQEVFEEKK